MSLGRVSCGSITSSRYPNSAAIQGLANFSLYSATSRRRSVAGRYRFYSYGDAMLVV